MTRDYPNIEINTIVTLPWNANPLRCVYVGVKYFVFEGVDGSIRTIVIGGTTHKSLVSAKDEDKTTS